MQDFVIQSTRDFPNKRDLALSVLLEDEAKVWIMRTVTIRPKWDWETYSCPECGQETLTYDGSVKWGHGPRPGRGLATKGPVGFSPRADFEIAHYFRCRECGIEFYDPVDSRRSRLFRERRIEGK